MKAIIHIGMPKTGTTSIQTWMHMNCAALEAAGVHTITGFPALLLLTSIHVAMIELGVDEKNAWQGVEGKLVTRRLGLEVDEKAGWPAMTEQKRFRAEKIEIAHEFMTRKLDKMSRKSGVFIWSDERFFNKKNLTLPLDKFLSRFFEDRTYVIYIRNTVDHFVSGYSQKLTLSDERFGTFQFADYLERAAFLPHSPETGSSLENLIVWHDLLGKRLNVRLLEPDWLEKSDLIEDFSSVIGIGGLRKPDRMNESFAAEYVEYIRFLNRKFGRMQPEDFRWRTYALLQIASSGKPKLAASEKQADAIRSVHGELEERVRKRFFLDRRILFSEKFRGDGIMPLPLTNSRMAEIESELACRSGSGKPIRVFNGKD